MKPLQRILAALATVSGLAGLFWLFAPRSNVPHEAVEPGPPLPEDVSPSPVAEDAGSGPPDAVGAPSPRHEPETEAQRAQRLAAEAVKAECTYWSESLERRARALAESPEDLERLQLLARDAVVALLYSQGRFEQRELGRVYPTPPRSLGHEIQVAGRFGSQAFLVPPAEFPEYWDVLESFRRSELEPHVAPEASEREELAARVEVLTLLAREALAARAKEL